MSERQAELMRLFEAHAQAEAAQDVEKTLATCTEDVVYEHPFYGDHPDREIRGRAALREYYRRSWDQRPYHGVEIVRSWPSGHDVLVAEVVGHLGRPGENGGTVQGLAVGYFRGNLLEKEISYVPRPAGGHDASPAPLTVRRVVTGHDAGGGPTILFDGNAPNVAGAQSGSTFATLWRTQEAPADIALGAGIADGADLAPNTLVAPSGSRFVVVEYPPGNAGQMNRTETIDYGVLLSGSLEMRIGNASVTLQPGDTIVQRGTEHAWFNRGSVPARIAFVILGANPIGVGKAWA